MTHAKPLLQVRVVDDPTNTHLAHAFSPEKLKRKYIPLTMLCVLSLPLVHIFRYCGKDRQNDSRFLRVRLSTRMKPTGRASITVPAEALVAGRAGPETSFLHPPTPMGRG